MTISLTGKVALNANINTEFQLGNAISAYRGVTYYKPSTATIGTFDSVDLNFSEFRGTANKITADITYSSDQQNITINTSSVPGYVANFSKLNITIDGGVYIGSNSTGSYALTITGFAAGDEVNLVNNGVIIGCGGNGGNNDAGGNPGGNALLLQCPVNITNNGTIAGGGGGGGGCSSGSIYGSCTGGGGSYTGSGGGGGAGYNAGSGGSGDNSGSSGTRTTGGAGGTNNGTGGTGGNPGIDGASSNTGQGGGGAGKYITGIAYANWIVTGTRLGPSS